MTTHHIPVLRDAVMDAVSLRSGMIAVDATFGGGGYTQSLCDGVAPNGMVIALDRDATAIAHGAELGLCADLVHANFTQIASVCAERSVHPDVIVADLGLSSDQLDDPSRGLSFLHDAPLDMRMDRHGGADGIRSTAAELLATMEESEIERLLREYGDEPYARRIARAIVSERARTPIVRTRQLADIVEAAVPRRIRRNHHVATRTFQALRIAVNDELAQLRTFLSEAMSVLAVGGRLAVVTFHSGEDRIVKQVFRTACASCICPPESPVCRCTHPQARSIATIRPTEEEIRRNPRARSARLRVIEKIKNTIHNDTTSTTT